MRHEDINTGIHIPYNWRYTGTADRTAAYTFQASDIGKLALQASDNSLWLLLTATGTWQRIGGAGVTSISASGSAQLTNDVQFLGASGITVSQVGNIVYIAGDGAGISLTLSNATPNDVATIGASGSSALPSRSDHIHRGVHSIQATGSSALYGDTYFVAGANITLSQAGQAISIASTASATLADATPADVSATPTSGTATNASRADHVHRGVHSVQVTGSSALYGDTYFVAGANITLTQAGQAISIQAASGGGTGTAYNDTPIDVAVLGASGTSDLYSRGDHIHKGVHSLRVSGSTQLFGDIQLLGASGTVLSQVGNIIYVAGDGVGSGGGTPLTVKELDGTPTVANVTTIQFSNGTVTDNGGGDVSVAVGGGSVSAVISASALTYAHATFI